MAPPLKTAPDGVPAPGRIERRTRRRRGLRIVAALLLAGVVVMALGIAWLGSESALRWALAQAGEATGGRLVVEEARGSVLDARAGRIVWHDGPLTVSVDDATLDIDARALWLGRLRLRELTAARVEVVTEPSDTPASMPASLALPIRFELVDARVDELVIRQTGSDTPVRLTDLRAVGRYAGGTWSFDTLAVRGPFGALQAGGTIAASPPFALTARALLETRVLDEAIAVDATAAGDLGALSVDARTVLRDASASARLRVAPFAAQPVQGGVVTLGGLDVSRFERSLPATRLDGRLTFDILAPPSASAGTPPPSGPVPPMAGALSLRNARPGAIDAGLLPAESISTRFTFDGERLRLDELAIAGPPGRLVGSASIGLPGGMLPATGTVPPLAMRLSTPGLDLRRVHRALRETALSGELSVAPERGGLAFDARLVDAALGLALDARARLDETLLTVERARLQARDGVAEFSGTAGLAAPNRFAAEGTIANLDPSRFAELPAGTLNGRWRASGTAGARPVLDASLSLTDSRWRGLPLSGRAALHWATDRVSDVDASLQLGATSLTARGALGAAGDRLRLALDATRLQELDARAGGRASVEAELRDALTTPRLAATARGRDLRWMDRVGVRTLELAVAVERPAAVIDLLARVGVIPPGSTAAAPLPSRSPPGQPVSAGRRSVAPVVIEPVRDPAAVPIRVTLQAEGLRVQGTTFETVGATIDGDADRHTLSARTRAKAGAGLPVPLDAALRVEGGLERDAPLRWRGRLLEATNTGVATVRLMAPAPLSGGAGDAALGPVDLQLDGPDGARLRLQEASLKDGRIRALGTLSGVPLRWLGPLIEGRGLRPQDTDALRLGARIDIDGTPGTGGDLRGTVEAYRESGDLAIDVPSADGGTETLRAGLQALQVRAVLESGRLAANATLRGTAVGSLTGEARAPLAWTPAGSVDLSVPLEGTLEVSMPSLAFTRALSGDAWRFDGALQARLALGGTLGRPDLTGRIDGTGLVAEQRELGMKLTDGVLRATLRERTVDIDTMRFASGAGSVTMTGTVRPDDRSEAVLTLDRMPIPLGAGQRLLLSGEARATLRGGRLGIRGALRADEGVIELTSQNAPELSSDVVVVRDSAESAARRRERLAARSAPPAERAAAEPPDTQGFRIFSDLQIDLGDKFRVFGAGVDARLEGRLTLRGRLPDSPRLTGTVKIAQGTYAGFGQKLEIERGTLVFSGPVDNPAIDIVAYRRYLPVEAGVALTGTARVPRLALVSRPDVPDQDKLSWLVLGTGSDTARNGGQNSALQAAAATLLATADPRFAGPGLASTFGLDVLSIRTAQMGSLGGSGLSASSAQDSVVTLGKRLSQRLFVSYEQSLRGLENLLRLQYEITERLSVRGRVGTENGIDLLWTYRYD